MTEKDNDIKETFDETLEDDSINTPMERFFFHQRRALEETGKALEALLPPEFRKHGGEASREFAKGFRILVDAAIDQMKTVSEKEDEDYEEPVVVEENDDDEPPKTTGSSKVKIKLD